MKLLHSLFFLLLISIHTQAQDQSLTFTQDETGYYQIDDNAIWVVDIKSGSRKTAISKSQLTPAGSNAPLDVYAITPYDNGTQYLLFVNATQVWRYKTRGDYWVYRSADQKLIRLGKDLEDRSLQFAKFSPDGKQVAYVSKNNIYTEDILTQQRKQLTTTGNTKVINGTFDWAYEEEFYLRDGFRWSPDSRFIAYWQVDKRFIRDFYMLNNTDSVYSQLIPVEYPKAGFSPSPVKIGVVSLSNSVTRWMQFEGDPSQHYITRMEWSGMNELIVQRLDRRQQESKLIYCNSLDGTTKTFYAEFNESWLDLNTEDPRGWHWINKGQDFLWISEMDGWKNLYKISKDGKKVTLLTPGDYDIAQLAGIDEVSGYAYVYASPNNPVQQYLYRVKLNSVSTNPELVRGQSLEGTHTFQISPTGKFALHQFSSHIYFPVEEWVKLPEGSSVQSANSIEKRAQVYKGDKIEYLNIVTEDNVKLTMWINYPEHFSPDKKYPVVFYVYGEAGQSTVIDQFGTHQNFLYDGDIRADGYIQVSVDHRGSPSLNSASWRKSIYKKVGQVNIRDIAMGAKEVLKMKFIDKERVAVWGWSGGGTTTLHLLFRYPKIFKTGIAIAPTARLDFYDNIYTERYMGLPQENAQAYHDGSAVNYAKDLQGNLLIVHGTLDDNVHYSNTELLLNELIKHNKVFEVMPYPNRSHSLSEGEGTIKHLKSLYTRFLKKHCKPGAL